MLPNQNPILKYGSGMDTTYVPEMSTALDKIYVLPDPDPLPPLFTSPWGIVVFWETSYSYPPRKNYNYIDKYTHIHIPLSHD